MVSMSSGFFNMVFVDEQPASYGVNLFKDTYDKFSDSSDAN